MSSKEEDIRRLRELLCEYEMKDGYNISNIIACDMLRQTIVLLEEET